MLAKIAPATNDFKAVARYLVAGKPGTTPSPDRVAWFFTQNLPTDDPDLAAAYMAATAQASPRTRRAAYHLMIAWHQAERPTPELMQTVARQTLDLAGLAEHQALVMGHGDRPHPHLHILLNRVHPDTGRAWKTTHDFARFDKIMRSLSEAHGYTYVPAHAYNPELTHDLPTKPNSAATFAGKRGAKTTRPQWSRKASRKLGEEVSEDLTLAATADDIEMKFADLGLALEPKGSGFVVGDGQSYTKLSRLGLDKTVHTLLRRRCSVFRPLFTVDGIDIVRALRNFGLTDNDDVKRAIEDSKLERAERALRRRAQTETMLTDLLLPPIPRDRRHRSTPFPAATHPKAR